MKIKLHAFSEEKKEKKVKKYTFVIRFEGTEEQKEDLHDKLTIFTQDYSSRIGRGEAELWDIYEE